MAEAVQGLADAYALLGELPIAAQHELADTLGRIIRDVLAEQISTVRKRTGALASGLTIQLMTERLRARAGLFGFASKRGKKNLGNLFYGLIVDKGRQAQKVVVQRRRKGAAKTLRNRRKRVEDLLKPYVMRVTALDPQPYIELPEADLDRISAQRLADFWARTIASAGSAA